MPDSAFSVVMPIRFSHSDPAGIVYYPNYFDMFNAVIEDWFTGHLQFDYTRLLMRERLGFPTVHAECDFFIPSRMGDRLTYTLILRDIGRSSIKLTVHGHVGAQERLRANLVLATISLESGKSVPIPDSLRRRFDDYRDQCKTWHLTESDGS